MRVFKWWGVVLLLLAGCAAVGPDYEEVTVALPDAELEQKVEGQEIKVEDVALWWNMFESDVITNLVFSALQHNPSMRVSWAKVREARARLGISRAGLLPEVDARGFYRRYRNSDNVGYPLDGDFYHAGFDAAWELDIFGRRRRMVEASQATFAAETAELEDVWVSLAAETVRTYVQLQVLQERLAVAHTNIVLQSDTLALTRSRAEAGLSDTLALAQAQYSLDYTRALLPGIEGEIKVAENTLANLAGVMPGELSSLLLAPTPIPEIAPQKLTCIPAELLRRRPDIRAAERKLAAQTAQIGVARADYYPTLRLTGSIGLESLEAEDFFKSGSRFFDITPTIVWPIFRAGSIRANVEVQTALQEQALALYEKAVLDAVKEVHNALAEYGHEYERCTALQKAVASARDAWELAQNQYSNGLSDFNNVLVAQRSLLDFEESLVISRGQITDSVIRLYKALGGGWGVMDDSE